MKRKEEDYRETHRWPVCLCETLWGFSIRTAHGDLVCDMQDELSTAVIFSPRLHGHLHMCRIPSPNFVRCIKQQGMLGNFLFTLAVNLSTLSVLQTCTETFSFLFLKKNVFFLKTVAAFGLFFSAGCESICPIIHTLLFWRLCFEAGSLCYAAPPVLDLAMWTSDSQSSPCCGRHALLESSHSKL